MAEHLSRALILAFNAVALPFFTMPGFVFFAGYVGGAQETAEAYGMFILRLYGLA